MEASLFRESFLSLYANLGFRGDDKHRSLMVTSANPQEGKSTVAVNLALAMARGDGRVLLVDADMRRPILPKIFGRNNGFGLTDLLQEGFDSGAIDEVIPEVVQGLYLLSNGLKPSDDPAGLFRSPNFVRLLETVKDKFTSVIWDSSPVLSASEVISLASVVERVLLVLGAGRVTREESRKAKACLERAGCSIVGAVLNNIDRRYNRANHSTDSAELIKPEMVRL
jgi:non-specific protein-tyrosine kinase